MLKSRKDEILGILHSYPTWNEAAKATVGQWEQAYSPQRVLVRVEKTHRWRCG